MSSQDGPAIATGVEIFKQTPKLAAARNPLVRVLSKRAKNEPVHPGRNGGHPVARWHRRLLDMRRFDPEVRIPGGFLGWHERRTACDHLVEHAADAVNIGPVIDRPWGADLLRTHVIRRSDRDAGGIGGTRSGGVGVAVAGPTAVHVHVDIIAGDDGARIDVAGPDIAVIDVAVVDDARIAVAASDDAGVGVGGGGV